MVDTTVTANQNRPESATPFRDTLKGLSASELLTKTAQLREWWGKKYLQLLKETGRENVESFSRDGQLVKPMSRTHAEEQCLTLKWGIATRELSARALKQVYGRIEEIPENQRLTKAQIYTLQNSSGDLLYDMCRLNELSGPAQQKALNQFLKELEGYTKTAEGALKRANQNCSSMRK